MNIDLADLPAVLAEANMAPSVHNTQPTRWRSAADGGVDVLEDTRRRLPAGDPSGRDAGISHGAAIEGLALACASRGIAIEVEELNGTMAARLRPVARLRLVPGGEADGLAKAVAVRRTYRGPFAPTRAGAALDALMEAGDVILIRDAGELADLAALNDTATLRSYRDAAFRAELLSWMRLSRRDPRWNVDGLNAEAMNLSRLEAAGAGLVLARGVFEALDRVGAAARLLSEASTVRSAEAVMLFHRPEAESPIVSGRRFYRLWLELAALGVAAAPMAVLADDVQACSLIRQQYGVPAGRRLITTFRVGHSPRLSAGPRPRLATSALVVPG